MVAAGPTTDETASRVLRPSPVLNTTVAASGQFNTNKCSGTATNPTAAVGVLCDYLTNDTVTNVNPNETYLLPGASGNSDGAENNGFYVGSNVTNGEVRLQYVWAYTAP